MRGRFLLGIHAAFCRTNDWAGRHGFRSGRMTKGGWENVKNADESIVWRSPGGEIIACVEKNKVLQEDLAEIRQVCQDALDDAVLMGCDEQQMRRVLAELINSLESGYPPGA